MHPRVGRQVLVLGLAGCLWSVLGQPSLLVLLGAYLLALVLLELPPGRSLAAALSPGALLLLSAALVAPGIAYGVRTSDELLQREGWHGASARLVDRARLQSLPALAPGLITSDHPQTLYVYAPEARDVEVSLTRPLRSASLGHGVFRVEYDPRRDGVPPVDAGRASVRLRVDGASSERELRVSTPLAHPRWFCLSPDRTRAACVSEETDELFWFDRTGLVRRQHTGDGPMDCAFVSSGEVAVSLGQETALELHRAEGGAPRRLELGAAQGRLQTSPSAQLLAVSLLGRQPALAFVKLPELAIAQRLALPIAADWLAFGPAEADLVISTRRDAAVRLLTLAADGGGYALGPAINLGRPAVTLARAADGSLLAATTDLRLHGETQLGNHFVQDQLITLEAASLRVTGQHLTERRSERQSRAGDVDLGLSPLGLHQARDGRWLVAFAGSDELARLRLGADGPVQPDSIDLGAHGLYAPHGVVELADGTVLVSSPLMAAVGVFAPNASRPRLVHLDRDDAWLLAHDRAALARRVGERGFYEATRSGVSCQSCHSHADSDEAAYNLGDRRLLPTLTVRGLFGTAPYLRDGSYPRLRDLHEVAQTRYRGYRRNQAARDETLEAFVESLPRRTPLARWGAHDLARERRGVAAFMRARCDTCHTPPAFTNLSTIPMALLFPELPEELRDEAVDTPSLLSVSASPPYLSDGRAATLEDVIERHNPRNTHGDVRALDAAARRDLVAFLESL